MTEEKINALAQMCYNNSKAGLLLTQEAREVREILETMGKKILALEIVQEANTREIRKLKERLGE